MNGLTTDSIDVTSCEREPIHIPGSIQPHGVLFVLTKDTLAIMQVSKNIHSFLGHDPHAVLNQPIDTIIGGENAQYLREALQTDQHILAFKLSTDGGERCYEGRVIPYIDSELVFEIEVIQQHEQFAPLELYHTMMAALARMQRATNLKELCQIGCEEIYKLSGFDHTMLYQFDEQWNGTVIAEAKRDERESYLDLRFPASDIPSQARQLYLQNWLRIIANVDYQPSALLPALNPITETPLDMSDCTLRSVSPVHIEYLKNMGIVASMSVSLITGGKLWGLLVCHHQTPAYLSHTTRYACELLGQLLSSFISGKEEYDHFVAKWKIKTILGSLLGNLPKEEFLVEGLIKYSSNLLALVNAEGLALHLVEHYVTMRGGQRSMKVGQCPDEGAIEALTEWLRQHMESDVFVTNALPEVYAPAQAFKHVASGLLAISLSSDRANFLLWFRPEVIQTVTWGGDPNKVVVDEDNGKRLHPRRSFEAWKRTTHMTSLAWQEYEIEAATALRAILVDLTVRDRIIKQRLRSWLRHD